MDKINQFICEINCPELIREAAESTRQSGVLSQLMLKKKERMEPDGNIYNGGRVDGIDAVEGKKWVRAWSGRDSLTSMDGENKGGMTWS